MEFEIINLREIDPLPRSEILSLWEENGMLDGKSLNSVVLGVKHLPTRKLVAVSTAVLKYTRLLDGYYYYYGIEALSPYGNRPILFQRTFDYLKSKGARQAKGLAAIVINPDITDKMILRANLTKVDLTDPSGRRLFYKDF